MFTREEKNKYNQLRKSQVISEYALFVAIVVSVLIVMQVYLSRSLQGHLKTHVDRLGGERVATGVLAPGAEQPTGGVFTPGVWHGDAVSRQTLSTWGFDYEHGIGIGFGIMTGGSRMESKSKLTGITVPDELAFVRPRRKKALLDGEEDISFFESIESSEFSPDAENILTFVGKESSNAEEDFEWEYGYSSGEEPVNAGSPGSFKEMAENISERYLLEEDSELRDPDAVVRETEEKQKAKDIPQRNQSYAEREGYDEAAVAEIEAQLADLSREAE